jgi:nucleotide-binding universal stress UspA family protein
MTTIILCTDGSDLATHAARIGVGALRPPDRVVIATVLDPPDESALVGGGFAGPTVTADVFDEVERALAEEGHDTVDGLARTLEITDAETIVLRGAPGPALCALASEQGATALVIGTRGRGGLARAVLGSVSDHLVRNAPCPVLVVGEESQAPPAEAP